MKPAHITLVLGGARSGKSHFAETLARESGLDRLYLATAQAYDDEMRERIARHRLDRAGHGWETVEEPLDLATTLRAITRPDAVVLVDCLTLWLSNVMLGDLAVPASTEGLLLALAEAKGPVILVSNEVGLGLVPETPLGRAFRDEQGRLNQRVAALASRVVFVAAGLPVTLKDIPR